MNEFRELSHDDGESLTRFYDSVYLSEFPHADERESLANMLHYLRRKADGWYGANNYHVLLAFQDGTPRAGSITDYLAEPNAGVMEFLAVDKVLRRSGIGRELRRRTEALLAVDAERAHGRGVDLVVAEMNDPFRLNPTEDSLDPFQRATIWHQWDCRRLDFPYVQPALSPEQKPVADLCLIAKTLRPDYAQSIPGEIVKSILRGYMRWAMRIDEPEQSSEYQRMAQYIDSAGSIPLVSLASYVGRDPARPLAIREVADAADPDLDAVLSVYAGAFPGGPTDVDPAVFRDSMGRRDRRDAQHRYHLWAARADADAPVEGMASFFTFPNGGFGGYVTLSGSLHGTGRFRLLLARMEERMVRDALGARGWFIECDPKDEAMFARCEFRTVDCTYRQPPLPGAPSYAVEASPPLRLMYKAFGRNFEAPVLRTAEFLAALEDIYRTVYRMDAVPQSPFYTDMRQQAAQWPDNLVAFR